LLLSSYLSLKPCKSNNNGTIERQKASKLADAHAARAKPATNNVQEPLGKDTSIRISPKSSISDKSEQIQPMENKPLSIQESNTSSENNAKLTVESEWRVFIRKIQAWLGREKNLSGQLNYLINPSKLIIGLGVLAICLKAYTTILKAASEIPLAPTLFEVIGTLSLLRFSITRLLRKQDRQQFFSEVSGRWRAFIDP